MRIRSIATAAFAAFVLAACGAGVQGSDDPGALGGNGAGPTADYIGVVGDIAKSVPAVAVACPALRAKPLPKNPLADQVFFCTVENRWVAGDGEWTFAQVRRATGGVDRLFAAYAHADAGRHGACNAMLMDPRIIWLHASSVVMVHAPQDACGFPVQEAQDAHAALGTEVVSETRVRKVQPQ